MIKTAQKKSKQRQNQEPVDLEKWSIGVLELLKNSNEESYQMHLATTMNVVVGGCKAGKGVFDPNTNRYNNGNQRKIFSDNRKFAYYYFLTYYFVLFILFYFAWNESSGMGMKEGNERGGWGFESRQPVFP